MSTYVEFGADTSKYEAAMKRVIGTTDSTLSMLSSNWVKGAAAAAGAVALLDKAWDQVAIGAKVEQQTRAFDNMAMSFGENGAAMIQELKLASGEALDTMTIIEKAGTAMMMGIAPEKLSSLMEIARMTSRQTGQEVSQAFSDIALAVGRQSKMILDNLGIIVNVEKANERYAAKLGKTAASLSETERKQAFLNATVEEGENLMAKLGDKTRTSSETVQMMTSDMSDMASSGARAVSNLLLPNLEALAGMLHRIAGYWKDALTPDPQPMLTYLETQKHVLEMERASMEGMTRGSKSLDKVFGRFSWWVSEEEAEEAVKVLGKRIELITGTIANYRLEQVGPIAAGMVSSIRPPATAEPPKTDEKAAREMAALEERATLEMAKARETLQAKSEMELFMEKDLEEKLVLMRTSYLENQVGTVQEVLARQLSEHDVYLQVRQAQIKMETDAEIEAMERREMVQKQGVTNMLRDYQYFFQEMGKEHAGAFKLYKAFAIAETIVNTYTASMAAYKSLAGIDTVGPALGAAAAAAAIGAGMAKVHTIMSTEPGTSAAGGGAVGTYPASPTTGLPEDVPAGSYEQRGSLTIVLEGDLVNDEAYVETIIERMNAAVESRDVRLIATHSRSAERLS